MPENDKQNKESFSGINKFVPPLPHLIFASYIVLHSQETAAPKLYQINVNRSAHGSFTSPILVNYHYLRNNYIFDDWLANRSMKG